MKAYELAEIMALRFRLQRMDLQADKYGRLDERTQETSREVDELVVQEQRRMRA